MKGQWQSSWSCAVRHVGSELWISSELNSSAYEASVRIKVNTSSFNIQSARSDIYRAPGCDEVKSDEISVLIGMNIMDYSSRAVAPALDAVFRDILGELIAEAARCALQSEAYIIKERGYPSFEEYVEFRSEYIADSCISYSESNRANAGGLWMEYIQRQLSSRQENLYHRHKSCHIYTTPDGRIFASVNLSDPYHEILIPVLLSVDGRIEQISASILRSPDTICHQGVKNISHMVGHHLAQMSKREISRFVGGATGCTHVFEMCYNLALTLKEHFQLRNAL